MKKIYQNNASDQEKYSKNIIFIFPRDILKADTPDEIFSLQAKALTENGYICRYVNIDEIHFNDKLKFDFYNNKIVYRGWMLNKENYTALTKLVCNANGNMLISLQTYLLTHHLPNWYYIIEDLTPKTKIFQYDEDIYKKLSNISWNKFFIKDYVKSLKTSVGSVIDDISKLPSVIKEMKKYRGTIEGGICVREFEEYIPKTETRYFSINGVPFGPNAQNAIPPIIYECCRRIIHPFFSIDIIKTKYDGSYRIIEIGDGQVSDHVGWKLSRFIEVLNHLG